MGCLIRFDPWKARSLYSPGTTQFRVPLWGSEDERDETRAHGGWDPEKQPWPDPGIGGGGYLKVPCCDGTTQRIRSPWQVGDVLKVSERSRVSLASWGSMEGGNVKDPQGRLRFVDYEGDPTCHGLYEMGASTGWSPGWAARFELTVLGIKAQKLHDVTEEEAKAEGACMSATFLVGEAAPEQTYLNGFKDDWIRVHRKQPRFSWASNPWIWCVTFKVNS